MMQKAIKYLFYIHLVTFVVLGVFYVTPLLRIPVLINSSGEGEYVFRSLMNYLGTSGQPFSMVALVYIILLGLLAASIAFTKWKWVEIVYAFLASVLTGIMVSAFAAASGFGAFYLALSVIPFGDVAITIYSLLSSKRPETQEK
jgi:hypothetical protein